MKKVVLNPAPADADACPIPKISQRERRKMMMRLVKLSEDELRRAPPHMASSVALQLNLAADADRVMGADLVEDLALFSRAVVLRITDAAGRWLRVQVEGENFATWCAA